MMRRRALDYTPATRLGNDRAGRPTGGAENFRKFIAQELMPLIASEFAVDSARETIWGHSYGALFVLDTLFLQPGLFDTYVATSPSIWFGDRAVLNGLHGFAQRLEKAGPRVLALTVGELEQSRPRTSTPPSKDEKRRGMINSAGMVGGTGDLASYLATFERLTVHHRVLTGESHGTTPLAGIAEAVGLAFRRGVP